MKVLLWVLLAGLILGFFIAYSFRIVLSGSVRIPAATPVAPQPATGPEGGGARKKDSAAAASSSNPSRFRGPSGPPHIKGPSAPPPGS